MITHAALKQSLKHSDLECAIDHFLGWLEVVGYKTYDPYDIWGTSYGKLSRRLYYRKHPLGFAMTAPLILMEILLPRLRTLFVRKDRYATADAQLALAFINLYEAAKYDESKNTLPNAASQLYLAKAQSLADDLLTQCVNGYNGPGWGYPFDWQHINGLMPKHTPHITATPYCYEVFTKLFEITGDKRYSGIAASIADFVFTELRDTPTGPGAAASSYTPHDNSRVVNASAYRAFVLFDAARRWAKPAFHAKALKNLRFILQCQRDDGAWLYAVDDPSQNFIDHFHTCFVLKNLYKINVHEGDREIDCVLLKGYRWYRKNLFDKTDCPKPYALAPRLGLVRFEMYDWAEAIGLGALLANYADDALSLAQKLARKLIEDFQLRAGYFPTRVYRGGVRHTFPYLRWPQAQVLLAFTTLVLALRRNSADCQDAGKRAQLLEV
jgi:hypothetical protein